MFWRATWLVCLGGLILVSVGCQRLHHEKSWTVQTGESKYLDVDAPAGEQKIEVKIEASEPVKVYVVLEEDWQDFQKRGRFDRTKALASKTDAKNETLQATVPAGKKYGVMVENQGKKSEVKVVLDGR